MMWQRSAGFHWLNWIRCTGKEETSSAISPLLPSITPTIARPPPTPSDRAGARVAAAAPDLSQSRRSPVDAARLAEHGGGPGGGGRPQADPEGPLQERHALHQRGEDLSAPGDR